MNKRGFTLIELLVVIAIVGILSSVVYTNISGLRDKARISAGTRFDSSTLHSIGDQLIGEWLFDTNASPTPDTSGFSNNGTISGATYATTSGYNGKGAYSFNGSSDYIVTANPTQSFSSSSFTISAWTKRSSTGTYDVIIGQGSAVVSQGLFFGFRDTNVFMFAFYGNDLDTLGTYTDNNWHQWVGSYDANTNQRIIYVDGVQMRSALAANDYGGSGVVYIGKAITAGYNFHGLVDDVRIYSSAVSGSDIQKLYAEGKPAHTDLVLK